jgi:hypothetical protein
MHGGALIDAIVGRIIQGGAYYGRDVYEDVAR